MAAACSIIRDDNQEILYTEAPNGSRSTLFDNLAERFKGTQEALPVWLTTKTKLFKDRVSSPLLNRHRSKLLNGLNMLGVKQDTIDIIEGTKQITLDLSKLEYTNLTPQLGPNALTTMTAYATPVEGGEMVKVGRIRYKVKGPAIEIDSSLLSALPTYKKGKVSDLKGIGLGGQLYTELFKYALKNNMEVMSSDNLSPASTALWNKLTNLGLARKLDGRYMLNSFPENFDENGEIDMASLLDFIDREGVATGVTLEMQAAVKDVMIGLNVNSSDELLSTLRAGFFPEGFFKPTRESLSRTNMYSNEEIIDMLTDESMQEKAKEFIYQLESVQEPILNDMYIDSTFKVVKDGTKNEIGKFKIDNPYRVEQQINQELGGIEIRSEFEEAMMESDLGSTMSEDYMDKKDTKDDLFNRMSKLKPVGELSIEEGILTPITSRTRETFEQTLTEPSTNELEKTLDFLVSLDNSMWRSAPNEITTIVKSAAKSLKDIGIDGSNLLSMAKKKSLEETRDFLNAARGFAIDANERSFDNLVREYDSYFDVNSSFKYKKTLLPDGITKDNTFFIEGQISGVSSYKDLSIIPVGRNLYKRVDEQTSEQLIDAIMQYMYSTNGYETILPKEAFSPAGFDEDGTINMSKMQDRDNALALRDSVSNWVQSEVGKLYVEKAGEIRTEELEKYVILFNYYNKSSDYSKFDVKPKMNTEFGMIADPVTNLNYLSTEFISDFNKKIINEKLNNTEAYTNFYSNFKFTRTGIDLVSNDPISLGRMTPYLADNKDIVNYFRSHKNRESLVNEVINEPIRDDMFLRNYYSNYPTALKPFTKEYTDLSNLTIAAATKAPFIRTSRGVYELIRGVGRVGIYGKISTNLGQYKNYNLNLAPPIVEESIDVLKNIDANIQDVKEIKNLYNEAEAKRIDDNYDNC